MSIGYDNAGRRASVMLPSGIVAGYSYDTGSLLIGITYQLGSTLLGDLKNKNLANVTDPLGHRVSMTYDSTGNLASISNANGTVQTSYNNGLPNSVSDPLQRTVSFQYDGAWRLQVTTDAAGNPTQYIYTPLNQVSQLTDALNGITSFDYDPNGNLLTVTDANRNSTTFTYDSMDRVATRTDPLLHGESYDYDLNGNLTQFTDRKGQPTIYGYDGLNRLAQLTFADQSTITYTWDAGNRLTQVVDSLSGTIARSYDGLDRLLSETTPQGTVSYTYDAAGRRLTMSATGQQGISYTYDDANRLTAITQGTDSVGVAYDCANLRTSLTLPNGVSLAYTYDGASELTGLTWAKNGASLAEITYGYDNAGRMNQMASGLGGGNLPAAVGSTTYNAANQLTQWGAATLSYDLNGNLLSDGASSYTWNARNQLAAMGAMTFQYDAFGRRIRNAQGSSFLYDGLNPIQELSGSTVTANLLTGLGIDEIFARSDSTGSYSFLRDRLGSTVALTDTSGTLQTQYGYEPFGKTTATGPASTNPYQFTGREDDGTGLYYYRARYYSPGLQRFVSEDPIGCLSGQDNLYSYAGDNPIGFIDPFGLDKKPNDKPSCFQNFLKNWANNLSPFPTDHVNPAKLLKGAAESGSAYYWNAGLKHAISRGLTSPYKSSTFRGLLNTSKAFGQAAFPAFVLGSGIWAYIQDLKERSEGTCQ